MKPIHHVTRVRWKWLFGSVFVAHSVCALVERWIFWQWDNAWKLSDVAMELGGLLLGMWLVGKALQGTRERLRFGAVTARTRPHVLSGGMSAHVSTLVPSGLVVGERVSLLLVCQLVEPVSDYLKYSEQWRVLHAGVAELTAEGIVVSANVDLPKASNHPPLSEDNYEVLTLHVRHGGGLDREFVLDWRARNALDNASP